MHQKGASGHTQQGHTQQQRGVVATESAHGGGQRVRTGRRREAAGGCCRLNKLAKVVILPLVVFCRARHGPPRTGALATKGE